MISVIRVECELQTLLTVLNATGNPDVAIKMLNGEYAEPFISDEKVGKWDTRKTTVAKIDEHGKEETVEIEEKVPVIYTFISYNPFTGLVTYEFEGRWGKEQPTMSLEKWNALENPYQLAV